jgi:hypothetical protein
MMVGSAPNFPDGAVVSSDSVLRNADLAGEPELYGLTVGPYTSSGQNRQKLQDRSTRRLLPWFIYHAVPEESWVR